MAGQNRKELLGLALLAAMIAVFLGRFTALLSEPSSTPMAFVHRESERRDGAASLGDRRSSGETVLRLAFVGDIMQHRRQAGDDFGGCYREVVPLLAESDLAAGNLEFPVDDTRPVVSPDRSVRFNGSPAHVAALAQAGFDVLSTANNRCLDQGVEGLARTQQVLRGFGLTPVGPRNVRDGLVVLVRNGLRVGFVAYTVPPDFYARTPGEVHYVRSDSPLHELNFADWSAEYRSEGLRLAARHVQAARDAGVDWLVALVHWGREWEFQPTSDQRLAGRDLIDQGFDMVVGGHGHVLNPVEVHRGRLIAYSLGSLISDFRPLETRTGAVLQVDLARSPQGGLEIAEFRAIPVLTEAPGHHVRPVRASGDADKAARVLAQKVMGPACVCAGSLVSAQRGRAANR